MIPTTWIAMKESEIVRPLIIRGFEDEILTQQEKVQYSLYLERVKARGDIVESPLDYINED